MADFDVIIRGGKIIDGTGVRGRPGSVAIRGGKIAAVGDVIGTAERTIDAGGQVIAPGFIDIHTHYDAQVFWDPTLSPSSCHGVTTVIGGNCGFSIAPLNGDTNDTNYLMAMLARVEGMPLGSLKEGVPWNWSSFGDYLSKFEGRIAVNAGFMVGHSALRRHVMGARAVGNKANRYEISKMANLLRTSLKEGGLGFSSTEGRAHNDGDGNPVPSRHAGEDELVALASVVSEFEGTLLEYLPNNQAIFEDDAIGRMTKMSLAAKRSLNWNLLLPDLRRREVYEQQLNASNRAAEQGAKIIALVPGGPPKAIISLAVGMLFDAFPNWAPVMKLPIAERTEKLKNPAVRATLNEGINSPAAGLFRSLADFSAWTIVETMKLENKELNGTRVGALASRLNKAPLDTLIDLAISEGLETRFSPAPPGDDPESWKMRKDAWLDDRVLIGGSDAGAHLDMIDTFAYSSQVLSIGVRERRLLPLEEAVYRMTSLPAKTFGIRDRGELKVGHHADIVVFNADTIGAGPVYARHDMPAGAFRLYADPIGVGHVFVNGVEIYTDQKFNDQFPGTVLHSGRDTYTVPI